MYGHTQGTGIKPINRHSLYRTDNSNMDLNKKISTLKGIGKQKAALFEKLGIATLNDLVLYAPRAYTDYSRITKLNEVPVGEYSAVRVKITEKKPTQKVRQGLNIHKLYAEDETGELTITFFNNRFAADKLIVGRIYRLYGKITLNYSKRLEINTPAFVDDISERTMIPRYPLTEGLTQQAVQGAVEAVLDSVGEFPEHLPEGVRREHELCTYDYAVKNLHFPQSEEALSIARRRLSFDELFITQCAMLSERRRSEVYTAPKMQSFSPDEFYAVLPFEPTGAQKRAAAEIYADMCRNVPMNRLVQGDVGSGKTAVAAAACCLAYKNGYQSALMAPTEILAAQHFKTLSGFLEPLGMKVGLLLGSDTAKEKRETRERLAAGEIDVIAGTHALIAEATEFSRLGLIITDEQHRFGVDQRKSLAQKGEHPHKLVMSATPIPRTLSLIIYGDLDISVINEMPKGRQKVQTFAVTGKLRERALNFVKKELDKGHQAYIVCPMIEENPAMEVQSAVRYAEELQKTVIGPYPTELLHGRMTGEQKAEIMQSFKAGDIKVLVSTTVIEVGVDVPNATIIMIESAERFGLSQLHQLRGRVGRGGGESYCVLLTDNPTEEVRERLKIMSELSDGFAIAEEDLRLRGAGEFFGKKQSGSADLKFADLTSDMETLSACRTAAQSLIDVSPDLSGFPLLKEKVEELMSKNGEEGMN